MNSRSIETVSLVLGSGGARGLAHIGVIDAVLDRGLEIRSIAGCSMGALVGAVYARDRLEEYRRWVCALERMDVVRLLDFAFGRNGLIKGERIIETMKELIGDAEIEDLPIQFTAVATDLDRQREVWISEGPLFEAIRASIAVPTLFTPFKIQGRRLVDGGLLNPVPIAPTLRDRTDATLAVNLAGPSDAALDTEESDEEEPAERSRLHRAIAEFIDGMAERFGSDEDEADDMRLSDIVGRSFDTMQNALTRIKLASSQPDLVIDVPRNACETYEFYRAERVIEIGRRAAAAALERFLGE